jgi:hypothetical protein
MKPILIYRHCLRLERVPFVVDYLTMAGPLLSFVCYQLEREEMLFLSLTNRKRVAFSELELFLRGSLQRPLCSLRLNNLNYLAPEDIRWLLLVGTGSLRV